MNTLKTFLLLGILTLFLIWVGGIIGGREGATFAFIISLIMNLGTYWFSDKLVLAMYRARPLSESEAPAIYRMVREITQQARLPMPKIYLVPQKGANAFATGRNPSSSAVAVTEGILDILNEDELKGVLAHEISHIKNRDILIGSIAAAIAGAIMMLANMARWAVVLGSSRNDRDRGGNFLGIILMSIIAPFAAMIIQMAISRSREYAADESAARILHSGLPLASALRKLEAQAVRYPVEVSPQSAHMFIVNPLRGQSILNLFSTHPPIEMRIERLERIKF